MGKLRVGILFGGRSAEHEVSILSARNVVAALDRARFEPVLIGIERGGRFILQDEQALRAPAKDPRLVAVNDRGTEVTLEPRPAPGQLGVDVIFPVLHGPMGEDGTIQGLLELAGIPYVGAGVLGSAVAMDKDAGKRLLRDAGLPITAFRTIRATELAREPEATLARAAEVGFPCFTKPANLGSSVGVRRVGGPTELRGALEHALAFDGKALVEAAVLSAREVECSVLGNDEPIASVPGEIVVRHADGFYSYDAKYVDEDGAALVIPAALPPQTARTIQDLALRVFRVLECAGMARVDFFLQPDGTVLVNELNTIPGFTAISMYPKLWEASGLPPRDLVTRLVDLALERHAARAALRVFHDFGK